MNYNKVAMSIQVYSPLGEYMHVKYMKKIYYFLNYILILILKFYKIYY